MEERKIAIHVSHLSRKKHESHGRAQESAFLLIRPSACARVPLGWWSLLPQDRTSICCLKLRRAVAED